MAKKIEGYVNDMDLVRFERTGYHLLFNAGSKDGVTERPNGTFQVRIKVNGRRLSFGSFATIEEAVSVRNAPSPRTA